MIRLRGIEKAFPHGPTKTYVLRRIDLDIKPGEFVSIMGPSGAGKSTLLHILGMHDQSWTGEYYFEDVPVHTLDGKKRAALRNQNIGFVFQSYHLLDDQTVFENLELPLSYRDVSKKDRQSIVCDTLDRFQMVGKKDLFPTQLSGGQQQLVGIARAVVASPRIILADEPTGNLHSPQGKEIMDMFKRLQTFRHADAGEIEVSGDESCGRFKRVRLAAVVEVMRRRDRRARQINLRQLIVDHDDAIRIGNGQFAQQHCIYDGKRRSRRCNAQRERQHSDDREASFSNQHSRAVTDVAPY